MRVAQFVPYFPPHKWGVETVAEEFSKYFISEKCWEVLNVTFSIGQKSLQSYQQDGYKVLIIPAFDIISNYPFPKFWTPQFRSVLKQVKSGILILSRLIPDFFFLLSLEESAQNYGRKNEYT